MTPPGWPRRGFPILPASLRMAWADQELPRELSTRIAGRQVFLGELDSDFWNTLEGERDIQPLASYVLSHVTNKLYHGEDADLLDAPALVGDWIQGVELDELPFATRTVNVLKRAGWYSSVDLLTSITHGELLGVRNAGPRTLLDFATVCEQLALHVGPMTEPDHYLQQELAKLNDAFPLSEVHPEDPRVSDLGLRGSSLHDALAKIGRISVDPDAQARARKLLAAVRSRLESLNSEVLEDALARLIEAAQVGHGEALIARLGWDGNGGCTLQEAGDLAGVSRERVRQLEGRLKKQLETVNYVPQVDRAIAVLNEAAARLEPQAADVLFRSGISRKLFHPHGVLTAAEYLDRPTDFVISPDGGGVQMRGDTLLQPLTIAFRSLTDVNHVASVAELEARARELGLNDQLTSDVVRSFVDRMEAAVWLDTEHNWFWDGRDTSLYSSAVKILAVTGSVRLETLRTGVLRNFRTKNTSLPRSAFSGLCRAFGFQVESDGTVQSAIPLSPEEILGSIEYAIFKVLSQNDFVMRGTDLRNECVAAGVNRSSFFVYLSYSPILERLATGVYALRGKRIDPSQVSYLAGSLPSSEPARRDHGWTKDGALWLGYEVSLNIYDSGVVFIPSGVRSMLGEQKLELFTVEGIRVGTFVISNTGNAWGLTPFINRRGVEIGDHLVVTIDTDLQLAVVMSGSHELVEAYTDGDGWGPKHYLETATDPSRDEA